LLMNPVLLSRGLAPAFVISPLGVLVSHMPVRMTAFLRVREAYMRYVRYMETKFQKAFPLSALRYHLLKT